MNNKITNISLVFDRSQLLNNIIQHDSIAESSYRSFFQYYCVALSSQLSLYFSFMYKSARFSKVLLYMYCTWSPDCTFLLFHDIYHSHNQYLQSTCFKQFSQFLLQLLPQVRNCILDYYLFGLEFMITL